MRTFLGLRIADNYENNRIISKNDYWSRKGFSIDLDLLEKRFIFDLVKKENSSACAMSDLEVCHDR